MENKFRENSGFRECIPLSEMLRIEYLGQGNKGYTVEKNGQVEFGLHACKYLSLEAETHSLL